MVMGIETELYELWGSSKEEEGKGKEEEGKESGKVALVFVPGNPGILGFYTDFFLDIFRKFPHQVCCFNFHHHLFIPLVIDLFAISLFFSLLFFFSLPD